MANSQQRHLTSPSNRSHLVTPTKDPRGGDASLSLTVDTTPVPSIVLSPAEDRGPISWNDRQTDGLIVFSPEHDRSYDAPDEREHLQQPPFVYRSDPSYNSQTPTSCYGTDRSHPTSPVSPASSLSASEWYADGWFEHPFPSMRTEEPNMAPTIDPAVLGMPPDDGFMPFQSDDARTPMAMRDAHFLSDVQSQSPISDFGLSQVDSHFISGNRSFADESDHHHQGDCCRGAFAESSRTPLLHMHEDGCLPYDYSDGLPMRAHTSMDSHAPMDPYDLHAFRRRAVSASGSPALAPRRLPQDEHFAPWNFGDFRTFESTRSVAGSGASSPQISSEDAMQLSPAPSFLSAHSHRQHSPRSSVSSTTSGSSEWFEHGPNPMVESMSVASDFLRLSLGGGGEGPGPQNIRRRSMSQGQSSDDERWCGSMATTRVVTTDRIAAASKERRKRNPRFVCPVSECGTTFTTRINFESHMDAHFGDKRFHCECGRKFVRQSDMKRHARIHNGIVRIHCELCNKSFTRKDTLTAHRKRDHAESQIQASMT